MAHRSLFVAALISTAALGAGIASAHETHYNSNVSMTFVGIPMTGHTAARGEVNSSKSGCEPDRLVKLFHVDGGPDTKKGKDKTNNNGEYQIDMGKMPQTGKYYTKVIKRNIGSGAHDHICDGDKSPKQSLL
jgi:hypothetical protein